jgi:hypothetical protein
LRDRGEEDDAVDGAQRTADRCRRGADRREERPQCPAHDDVEQCGQRQGDDAEPERGRGGEDVGRGPGRVTVGDECLEHAEVRPSRQDGQQEDAEPADQRGQAEVTCGGEGDGGHREPPSSGVIGRADVEDDLAAGSSVGDVLDGRRGVRERVGAVDDRGELAGLGELGEDGQVLVVLGGDERAQRLAHEGREQHERASGGRCRRASGRRSRRR